MTMKAPEVFAGEFWFLERHADDVGLLLRVKRHLTHRQSPYQIIDVFDTYAYGRVLTLDRLIMLTERDEAAYHEMLVHVPMLTHPDPRRVLVVGGGDGGVLRELLRHRSLERAVQVEIDREVVEACREFFPWAAAAFDDPRVELVVGDGLDYVKGVSAEFDLVIIDSTDPVGPAVGLFKLPFYRDVHKALDSDGIMACQIGSPFYSGEWVGNLAVILRQIFSDTGVYLVHVPCYPSGVWSLDIASKGAQIGSGPDEVRYDTMADDLRYYNPAVHRGSFMLPEYLRRKLEVEG